MELNPRSTRGGVLIKNKYMKYQFDRAEINVFNTTARRNGQIVFKGIVEDKEISIQLKIGEVSDLIRQLDLRPVGEEERGTNKIVRIYR